MNTSSSAGLLTEMPDFSRESFDHIGHESVSILAFDPHLIFQNRGLDEEARAHLLRQQSRVACGFQNNHVAADFAFQFRGRAQSNQIAFVQDGESVATLGLFHQVRGHQHGNMFFIAQHLQILPQVAARAGVESGRRLIEQQHSRMVQQALCQFDSPLHPTGKCFDAFFGAVGQANAI